MKRTWLVSFFAALPALAPAQVLTFCVEGGGSAQPPIAQGNSSTPFVLGPTVTLRISSAFSLESGVLYQRLGVSNQNYTALYPENSVTVGSSRLRANAIELPFLLKYHFLSDRRTWRPFVSAGPAVRRTSVDVSNFISTYSAYPLATASSTNSNSVRWNVDPEVGAGVSFRSGRVHLEPEIRYSHWGAGKNSVIRQNQVNFLFGFRI